MPDKHVAVYGDSVTWGQGHKEEHKFASQVVGTLGATMTMMRIPARRSAAATRRPDAADPSRPIITRRSCNSWQRRAMIQTRRRW